MNHCIQTHIYWMTSNEYEVWSTNKPKYINVRGNTIVRRTKIYFED